MCPFCLTTAVLIAGKVTFSGGLAAIAIRKLRVKNAADINNVRTTTRLTHKER